MSSELVARILVVDDEPGVRGVLVRALRDAGYEVVGVHDGLAALDACKTAATPYDLVITNNRMPHLSGRRSLPKSGSPARGCPSYTSTTVRLTLSCRTMSRTSRSRSRTTSSWR